MNLYKIYYSTWEPDKVSKYAYNLKRNEYEPKIVAANGEFEAATKLRSFFDKEPDGKTIEIYSIECVGKLAVP